MTTLDGVTPYPLDIADHYRASGYWEDTSIARVFDEVCTQFADRVALVAGDEHITYRHLATRAERLALHLIGMGLRPQERFVMQLPNIPEFVYLYLALQKIGAIPIMALPNHRYTEISHFITLSQAVGYASADHLGDFNFLELAERLQRENSSLRYIGVAGEAGLPGSFSFADLLHKESELPQERLAKIEIDPTLPALFLLSGGTTGVPKLIPRTHNDYIYNSKAAAAINDIRVDDSLLMVLPMAHNFPLACPGLHGFLLRGARIVLCPGTRTSDVFSLIERERIKVDPYVNTIGEVV